jgi:hypothetical protein
MGNKDKKALSDVTGLFYPFLYRML